MADEMEREGEDGGGDAGAAAGHHRAGEIAAGGAEALGNRLGGEEGLALRVEQVGEGQVEAAGNVPGAAARPDLRLAAGKAACGAGVDDLLAAIPDVGADRLLVAHL